MTRKFPLSLVICMVSLCLPTMSVNTRYPLVDSSTPNTASVCNQTDLPSPVNNWNSTTECAEQIYFKEQSPGGSVYGITVSNVRYAHPYYAAWIDVTKTSNCCILRASLYMGRLALLRNQRLDRPCCLNQKCSDVFNGSELYTGFEDGRFVYMGNLQHITMYAFFLLRGIVDIIMFITARFHLHDRAPLDILVHMLLDHSLMASVLVACAECAFPDVAILGSIR
ncbi:transmembrane protein 45B-like [Tropilaelaps mercedesae]|uniref:Transmembrane protein 45B-like n=1 Tax=Tropilaelaps mercedesae TaxID=418985 RepID=A0A1V9XPU8_9ACAR|nr:transmembrane protein 45B-like [Tropilaelaps mercedesae]